MKATESNDLTKEMLQLIIDVAKEDEQNLFKRIKDFLIQGWLETGCISLDDVLSILENNGIDIDKFQKFLYKNTTNTSVIYQMKLRVERKEKEVQDSINCISDQIREKEQRIDELDRAIYEKKCELNAMREDLTPYTVLEDEKGRPLYIGEALEKDYLRGGYKSVYSVNELFLGIDRKKKKPELSSEDNNHYTELIRQAFDKYGKDLSKLDEVITLFFGEEKYDEIIEKECPGLEEYRKKKKDEKKATLEEEIREYSTEMESLKTQLADLEKKKKSAQDIIEGLRTVLINYERKLPGKYRQSEEANSREQEQ